MKKINLSLKQEIVIEIAILLISALVLLGAVVLKFTEKIFFYQQIDASRSLVISVHTFINTIIQKNEIIDKKKLKNDQIFQLIHDSNHKNPHLFMNFINMEGTSVFGKNSTIKLFPMPLASKKMLIKDGKMVEERLSKTVFFLYPIRYKGRLIGALEAIHSLSAYQKRFSKIWGVMIAFILMDVIIFVWFGTYLLSKSVITPLNRLLEAQTAVKRGDFSYKIEADKDNEIGRLVQTFNAMSESLKEKLSLLNRKNMELEKTKDEVLQSEKLASVGILAAGVAHEIGNPLGSLQTYIEILIKENNYQKDKDILERMKSELSRIDKIVRELLDLSSPARRGKIKLNINKLIEDTVELLNPRKLFYKVQFHLSLSDNIPIITANEIKLQQVLINLLINAKDAMPKGGDINISTEVFNCKEDIHGEHPSINTRISDPDLDFSSLRAVNSYEKGIQRGDRVVKIAVKDTGMGIKQEYIPKIFDPFFTTKDPGKGTGLGLSICHRIITDMRGILTVHSQTGKGTCIEIILP